MNIPSEPSNTCPMIDNAIQNLKWYVESYFNDIRYANIELRDWGESLESIINDLEIENRELKEKIYELEGKQ